MRKEFMAFLKQYGVIGLAIAVVIGGKVNSMVTALVDGIIMPVVGLITPSGDWRNLGFTLKAGAPPDIEPTIMKIGPLLGATLDFLIVALIVFWFAKKVLKEETVAKK